MILVGNDGSILFLRIFSPFSSSEQWYFFPLSAIQVSWECHSLVLLAAPPLSRPSDSSDLASPNQNAYQEAMAEVQKIIVMTVCPSTKYT